ncbi:imm11 family protein [Clostridium butyricum]|uniref:Immunity MXAN-0049 protein domain-containing protein n=1 Tax=Clostridium butyricum TaxID=1492 RepID=A0AAP9UET3_CLOBU|nr:DUF1629 domain-containing protein [Clostridium butyricum]MBZ5746769.1 hypothetical protein [Clostridium butyricum]MCQ2018174.1 hypothetical protein [Clostridium butyricum]MCQ2022543.1 hypothetical protein [Clostridium butyricum]NFB72573.1 hypothetical protein [Clostridium butyricum]NFB91355.1 hypothetical protein [Clostridium butyricum]
MDYFLLKKDERYRNTPRIKSLFKYINVDNINIFNADKIDDAVILQVEADDYCVFTDIIDTQIFMVCERMQKIISKYDPEIIFKILPLIDRRHDRQENYYLPIIEEIEALSDRSKLNMNKTVVEKIVLDKSKISGQKIFRIKESEKPLIVVSLDVAESLLRRKFKGISLERLEID